MPTGGTPPVLRELGRLAGGDARRQHAPALGRVAAARSTGRSRCASSISRRRCGGRPSSRAEVQRLVREAADWDGEPFDRDEYAARRDAAGRDGGGPEAERQLELGPEAAVREIADADGRLTVMATQTETIQVGGVRCERCVMRLAHALEGQEGLEGANANLMGQVTLAWDDEQTSREAIVERLAKAGFPELAAVCRPGAE